MEVKWIEDFIALAHHQSFSRAAQVRNVTQSGFSRRIQSLEQWLGADLVDRSTYPPTLTAAGRIFREASDDILQRLFEARALIRGNRRMPGQGLLIATSHSIALNFLPTWLHALVEPFPELRARVMPGTLHDTILMLVSENCDLMFAYHHPELALQLDPVRYPHLTVGIDTLMPVCRPQPVAVADGNALATEDGKPLPLIGYTEHSYFGRCVRLLWRRPETPLTVEPRYESDVAEVLKKLVLEGQGVAWLPKSAIGDELANGALVPAGGPIWTLKLELRVYRDAQSRDERVEQLWRHLRAANSPAGATGPASVGAPAPD